MITPKTILILRWARLGDVILTEPAARLCRQLFPDAHISYLTGHRCAPVVRMMPAVDEVISLNRVALRDGNQLDSIWSIGRFANEIRRRHFDVVIDLTGFRESELLTWWSRARWRLGLRRYRKPYWGFCFNLPPVHEDKSLLVAEMFRRVVASLDPESASSGIDDAVSPELRLSPEIRAKARAFWEAGKLEGLNAVYGFQLSASDSVRSWPTDRFIELARRIGEQAQRSKHSIGFVSFGGPHDAAKCEEVTRSIRESGYAGVAAIGSEDRSTSLPEMAARFERCTAVVSNDTGLMHLSAAVGAPTLGLFSIGVTDQYRPLGRRCSFLKRNLLSQLTAGEVSKTLHEMMAEPQVHPAQPITIPGN